MDRQYLHMTTKLQEFLLKKISLVIGVSVDIDKLEHSFTALGGDSLAAIALSTACSRVGIQLSISSILLHATIKDIINHAKTSCNSERLEEPPKADFALPATQREWDMIAECTTTATDADGYVRERTTRKRKFSSMCYGDSEVEAELYKQPAIAFIPDHTNIEETLTEMQMLLIRGCRPEGLANNIRFSETYRLSDLNQVKTAWNKTINQVESLHRRIGVHAGGEMVDLGYQNSPTWEEVDTDNFQTYQHEILKEFKSADVGLHFKAVKLDRGLHENGEVTIIWNVHHALIDGYSASLVYSKFQDVLNGRAIEPGPSFFGITRQLKALQRVKQDQSQCFWKKRQSMFTDAIGEIHLPKPMLNPYSEHSSMSKVKIQSPVEEMAALCRQLNCTTATLFCTAWAVVLSRYVCSESVTFGVVCSGRSLPLDGLTGAIGPTINVLPMSVRLNQTEPITRLIRTIFEDLAALNEVEYSRAQDGFNRSFSSALAMQFDMRPNHDSLIKPLKEPELDIVSDVPLSICVIKHGVIQISYRTSQFRESDMKLLAEHYQRTLQQLVRTQETVGDLADNVLTHQCQQRLLDVSNAHRPTTRNDLRQDTLTTLFARTVSRYPQAIALERDGVQHDYRSFQDMVKQVASHLRHHVWPGDAVCVYADRSVNWIVAIYAVITLGAVYVPLNPQSSPDVRETNFNTCESKLFLVPANAQLQLAPASSQTVFSVESLLSQESESLDFHWQPESLPAEAPAYICFTSGSTGPPKAVLCTHESIVAFQSDLHVRLMAKPGTRISQVMSPVFDGSIHEIFSALSYGATLVLADATLEPVSHLSKVTSTIMTPSLASVLDPRDFPNLKYVYLVGEAVPQKVCDDWAHDHELYNMYGPTEGTCGATIVRLQPHQSVTIGKPNPSTRVYILDHKKRLVPPGVTGEICIAGVQVARGYLGHPTETQARFIRDTVCSALNEFMYCTGDHAYWTSNGEIVYVGRRDRQIKLHGFRVDLNNLERRMAQAIPEANATALVYSQDRLTAIFRPQTLSLEETRRRLSEVLEPQLVPQRIFLVDELPLTPAGKIDYKQIEIMAATEIDSSLEPIFAMTRTERALSEVWRLILDLKKTETIDTSSNFLYLGGHSLSQLELQNHISKVFHCSIAARDILKVTAQGSLRDLARLIDTHPYTPVSTPLSASRNSDDTVQCNATATSEIERRWWYQYQSADITSQFNVSLAWRLNLNEVELERLSGAFNLVLGRHNMLRSIYVNQKVEHVSRFPSSCLPNVSRMDTINLEKECNVPFELPKGPLIRVLLSSRLLLICASHIILDLSAFKIILEEVKQAYRGETTFQTPPTYIARAEIPTQLLHSHGTPWYDLLKDNFAARLSRCKSSARNSYTGSSVLIQLGPDLGKAIRDVTARYYVTKHQVVLTAVSIALADSSLDTFVIGAPWINRDESNAKTVGLFLEILPVMITNPDGLGTPTPVKQFLQDVQRTSQESLSHATPWSVLSSVLGLPQDAPIHMLIDAMVTFHDENDIPDLGIPGTTPVMTWSQGAKFKVMFEFTQLGNGQLMLRVEFNSNFYSKEQALILGQKVASVLPKLLWEGSVQEVLKSVHTPEYVVPAELSDIAKDAFGKPTMGTA